MACSYAKAWGNSIVRKNFNFLENIKHGRPLYTYVKAISYKSAGNIMQGKKSKKRKFLQTILVLYRLEGPFNSVWKNNTILFMGIFPFSLPFSIY